MWILFVIGVVCVVYVDCYQSDSGVYQSVILECKEMFPIIFRLNICIRICTRKFETAICHVLLLFVFKDVISTVCMKIFMLFNAVKRWF